MEERKNQKERPTCNVILENRSKLSVSGVEDVDNFDESNFTAITCAGALVVRGADLHISKLNVDTGELVVDGEIDSCVFNNSYGGKSGGLFSKIFR